MIVPMKKIFMIVQGKDIVATLNELRDLGVVHVEHLEPLAGEPINELRENISDLKHVLEILTSPQFAQHEEEQQPCQKWKLEAEKIINWYTHIDHLKDSIIKEQIAIDHWEPWGDFSPEDIVSLNRKGVRMCLCQVPRSKLDELPHEIILKTIFIERGLAHCVAINSDPEREWPFTPLELPPAGLVQLRGRQEQMRFEIDENQRKISEARRYLQAFKDQLREQLEQLDLEEVMTGMQRKEALAILKGYVPAEKVKRLENKARESRWGLLAEDPGDDDQVPTLLRYPKWVELINPVFKMIEIIPGYREVDISPFFLVFFSLFFGIIIGDAGYGLIFALGTALFNLKFKNKPEYKNAFTLMYILSGCAVVWGLLTGTFFGQAWLENRLGPLVPWLADQENVQFLCFIIAAIQLSIAHIWNMLLKYPSLAFLSDFGWLNIIWFMFFLAGYLVLRHPLPNWSLYLLYVGIFFVVCFTKPQKNPLKAVGAGFGDLLLNIVNAFGDVVSYIRLFAVSLAAVAVADAFNSMALGFGFSTFGAGFLASCILVVGHLLNTALGGMSVLVHGLRLNVLEFSGHLNIEWAGHAFQPFRRIKKIREA